MKRKKHEKAVAWYGLDFSHTLAPSFFFMSMRKKYKFATHRGLGLAPFFFFPLSLSSTFSIFYISGGEISLKTKSISPYHSQEKTKKG